MRSFGLIGYPLAHSFSAEWFAEMFRREGIRDAVYANYPLGSIEELPALLAEHPLLGFNVTAPYKRAIMDYLDQIDPTAERIGAVNCAVRQLTQQLHGCNWCFYFVYPLFNVFFIFPAFPLYFANPFQHRFFSHFHNLVKNLFISPFRHLHDFRQ